MFPTRRAALLALLPLLSLPGLLAFAPPPLLRAHTAASGAIRSAQPAVCRRRDAQQRRTEPLALIAGLDAGAVAHILKPLVWGLRFRVQLLETHLLDRTSAPQGPPKALDAPAKFTSVACLALKGP